VASIATWLQRLSTNHANNANKPSVVVSKCPAFPRHLAAGPNAHTGNDRRLVDVKTTNSFVHHLHRVVSTSCAASVGSPIQKKPRKRAPGALLPLGASEGHQGTPGPTRNRALAHQGETDLLAGGWTIISHRPSVSSTRVGPKAGTQLAMTIMRDLTEVGEGPYVG
jgi:hypothetical protein